MNYFFTLLWLRLKATLRSAAFLVTALFFLVLTATLAAAFPQNGEASLSVGLLSEGEAGSRVAASLAENDGYSFLRYEKRAALERDILTGKLHCGYVLGEGERPITALETKASYMRPLIDELVLAAWLGDAAPGVAGDILMQNGLDSSRAAADFERLRKTEPPMAVTVRAIGAGTPLSSLEQAGVQPLAYAVMITLFTGLALAAALLEPCGESRAYRQLARTGHRFATAGAPVAARALLNGAVLLLADGLLHLVVPGGLYSLHARLLMIGAQALFSALLALAVMPLRRVSGAAMVLLPPFLLVGVLCSGALINPESLPFGLGMLRFLSPAWYGLRLMSML